MLIYFYQPKITSAFLIIEMWNWEMMVGGWY